MHCNAMGWAQQRTAFPLTSERLRNCCHLVELLRRHGRGRRAAAVRLCAAVLLLLLLLLLRSVSSSRAIAKTPPVTIATTATRLVRL
jgi:hypothetical protein